MKSHGIIIEWARKPWTKMVGITLLFLVVILASEWSFLSEAGSIAFDTRRLQPTHDDKFNELMVADEVHLRAVGVSLLALPHVFPRHDAILPHLSHFNQLPPLLLKGLSEILPRHLAYNLLHLVAWLISGLALFGLSRRLGASTAGALSGGLLFILSPVLRSTLRYISLDFGMVFWLPLLGLSLLKAAQLGRKRDIGIAAAVIVGLAATNYYYFLSGIGLCVALLLARSPLFKGERSGEARRVLISIGLGALLVAPQIIAQAKSLGLDAGTSHGHRISFLSSSRDIQIAGMFWHSPWVVFVGSLGLIGVFLARRGVERITCMALAVLVVLSSGANLLLMVDIPAIAEAIDATPMLWRMRRVEAFWLLPAILGCALAGVGLSGLARLLPRRGATAVPAVGLVTILGLSAWAGSELEARSEKWPTRQIPDAVLEYVRSTDPSTRLTTLERGSNVNGMGFLMNDLVEMTGREWSPRITDTPREGDLFKQNKRMRLSCPVVVLLIISDEAHPGSSPSPSYPVPHAALEALDLEVELNVESWMLARPRGCYGRNRAID